MGYQTRDGMGFQTHDGVPDRGGVPVIWWDTRHMWGTRQGWWGTRYGWWGTRQVVVYQMQVMVCQMQWGSRLLMRGYQTGNDGVPGRGV